ncbi:LysR family transcriptional regulator, partial [Kineococcus indalonis]|uniref:LysR family transcriptional regulator n=1 Tax=Kineococcus indalonis TaxID=2696566 RepID=UPI002B1BD95C
MELRQLEHFVAVVDEGGFTAAAARLRVAQPGVSTRVRNLERELGQPLLERGARGVRLTEAGRAALPHARAALAAAAAVLPCTALSAAAAASLAADLPPVDLVVVLGARSTATSWVLPALARARQVVVVGDPALPRPRDLPTAASARPGAPAGPAGPADGPRGLLDDAAGVLPALRLERQHACLDDRLLEGVVAPGAQDSLPGAGPDPRAVLRTSARAARGGGARRRPDVLVELVTDAVVDALRRRPAQSVGVVVPDAEGAELLGDAVRRRLADHGLPERGPAGRAGEQLLVAQPARWTGERRDHVVVVADAVVAGEGLG